MSTLLQRSLILVAVCGCFHGEPGLGASDPAYYVRRATWQESLAASLEAISRQMEPDAFAPFEAVRGGTGPSCAAPARG